MESKRPTRAELAATLRELLAWEEYMGSWESPVWKDARKLAARLEKTGAEK